MSKNKKEAEKLGVSLTGDFGPVKVPKGKYFVMGDNRLNSMDSRNGLGLIAEDRIVGTSKFVFSRLTKCVKQNKNALLAFGQQAFLI